MITDKDLEAFTTKLPGMALVWVIDGQCLYDMPVNTPYFEMFTDHDSVEDVSSEYPSHMGIAVRFYKGGEVIDDLLTSEYFGSILLSEPLVVDLSKYPYGRYVESPNATFDGEKFIIDREDYEHLMPWYTEK